MTAEKFKRKLTAILSADVKGYSRLMGEDEEGTIRTLNAYLDVTKGSVQKHRGRVVNTAGDSVLAEFASVVDAVRSAVEIQEEVKERNKELPEGRRMEFRIGINLGDVVEEGDNILGDGVNVAARVQSLAEGGGICISGTAYDQIKNKLAFSYDYVGEQAVKNIKEPVRVYRIVMEPGITISRVAGEKKAEPMQWQRSAIGLVVILIAVVAAIVIWKLYIPLAPQPEVASKEKITVAPSEKLSVTVPTSPTPSVEPTPKEKVTPPSPEKVTKPAPPPAPKMEVASKEKMAFPLPDLPSIAVLPFANMSDDPQQQYFSDGLAEEIITALSKVPNLFIIASDSTFVYKGKAMKIRQVAEELGVRYVLEGSVRRSGDNVRVTTQLIDALNGRHLWAERYDRNLKDFLAVQDEITLRILTELQVKVTGREESRVFARGTENLQAYLKVIEGHEHEIRNNKEENAIARRLFQEAIELDPNYAMAYRWLGWNLMINVFLGAASSPKETLTTAISHVQKAIELDNSSGENYALLGQLFVMIRQHDKGIELGERALTLSSNSAWVLFHVGMILNFSGRSEDAVPLLQRAIRLNPFMPNHYHHYALACRETGRYEEAIAALKKAQQIAPNDLFSWIILTTVYIYAGREEEARAAAKEVLRIDPDYSVERQQSSAPWKNPSTPERSMKALRKAGLK
jgi:adenylate cyclase